MAERNTTDSLQQRPQLLADLRRQGGFGSSNYSHAKGHLPLDPPCGLDQQRRQVVSLQQSVPFPGAEVAGLAIIAIVRLQYHSYFS
jgi:hypothetical protein